MLGLFSSCSEQGLFSSWGTRASHCSGFLLLRSTGSVVVTCGFRCPAKCGIFPDQGLNLCLLHWQADPSPLSHQGSPRSLILSWDLELKGLRHLFIFLLCSRWGFALDRVNSCCFYMALASPVSEMPSQHWGTLLGLYVNLTLCH